jgi:hypothetical protein
MDASQRSHRSRYRINAISHAGMSRSSLVGQAEGPTLEVRWIRPGALTGSMIDWFGSGGDVEQREDVYLIGERIRGMSVKIRGGAQLELKVAGGTRGVLEVKGRVAGHMESWQKWSFPLPSGLAGDIGSPEWVTIGKVRHIRWFSYVDGVSFERALDGIDAPWDARSSSRTCPWTTSRGERWVSRRPVPPRRWRERSMPSRLRSSATASPTRRSLRRPIRCPTCMAPRPSVGRSTPRVTNPIGSRSRGQVRATGRFHPLQMMMSSAPGGGIQGTIEVEPGG